MMQQVASIYIGVILVFLCFCGIKLIYNTLCPEMEHFLLKLQRIGPITTTTLDIFILSFHDVR